MSRRLERRGPPRPNPAVARPAGRGRRRHRARGRAPREAPSGDRPASSRDGRLPGDGTLEDRMGLLDGKTALIFGVANDHSIAWGIAQALHAEGAEVGFSSVESLIEKRVRPLAESIGSTFVEPCDVGSDEQIAAVFARWGETHESLDILVHALAFARREDLEGGFLDTSRDGFALALDVSAYSLVALTREARPLLRRGSSVITLTYLGVRAGRRQLQRHGRRQGRPRGVRPLPRRRPRPGRGAGQRHLGRAGADAGGGRDRRVQGDVPRLRRHRAAARAHHARGRRPVGALPRRQTCRAR